MAGRSFIVLGWLALTGAPFLAGMLFAMLLRRPASLLLAVALPWLVFLAFNAFTGQTSPDRYLLQGTFWFFQLTLGSACAIAGGIGHLFLDWVRRRNPA